MLIYQTQFLIFYEKFYIKLEINMSVAGIMKGVDDEAKSLFKKNDDLGNGIDQPKKSMTKEDLGDKILMYLRNAFWVCLAVAVIYYSNFFHHLFLNPKIN